MAIKVDKEQLTTGFNLSYHDTDLEHDTFVELIEACNKKTVDVDYVSASGMLEDMVCSQISNLPAPVGVLYSGGVDSTFMLCMLRQCYEEKDIKTISVGYEDVKEDESCLANDLADKFGITNRVVHTIFPYALSYFESKVTNKTYKNWFFSSSLFPTFIAFNTAKNHVSSIVTGDGGDELFCGYDRFLFDQYYKFYPFVKPLIPLFLGKRRAEKAKKYEQWGYRGLVSIWDLEEARMLTGNLPLLFDRLNYAKEWTKTVGEDLHNFDRLMLVDIGSELYGVETRKVDTAKRMAEVEDSVHPFLDLGIMKYCLSLPIDLKYKKFVRKWMLREMISERFPEYRKMSKKGKKGFASPFGTWLRKYFSGYKRIEGDEILNDKYIKILLEKHISGKKDLSEKMWSVYMYNLLKEKGILEVI